MAASHLFSNKKNSKDPQHTLFDARSNHLSLCGQGRCWDWCTDFYYSNWPNSLNLSGMASYTNT